ncbi:hypothetical protein SAMN04487886_101921 [Clostridium sp. DSM 8431]|nr:hypothetical protein SAMN04487886_101921 [Clostridium sp. DSM 8431]
MRKILLTLSVFTLIFLCLPKADAKASIEFDGKTLVWKRRRSGKIC